MTAVDVDALDKLREAATVRCWDDKPGCNCANQGPRPPSVKATTYPCYCLPGPARCDDPFNWCDREATS